MRAITTCVDYDDYLSVTLPLNIGLFKKFYVVTSTEDTATQDLCNQHGATVIITDRFYEEGAIFNKGKAINEALNIIKEESDDGWVCHLDADIILPKGFNDALLETDTIYGCPRLMCPNISAWKKYLATGSTDKWRKSKACYFRVGNRFYNQHLDLEVCF